MLALSPAAGAQAFSDLSPLPASHRHAPISILRSRNGSVESYNWSGYAVDASNRTVTNVLGSWVVPTAACTSTDTYSSFWVGIDGYSSSTVEQTGTDSDCSGGSPSYYAWFEVYPHPSFEINTITVSPGDVMSASVVFDTKGKFTVSITDTTNGQTFSTSPHEFKAKRSSAQCIAEAPSVGGAIATLTNFGSVWFGEDNTGVQGSCGATIDGTTAPLGTFAGINSITMVNTALTPIAVPSALSSDGSSFTVAAYPAAASERK
jgi:hypothetical protein